MGDSNYLFRVIICMQRKIELISLVVSVCFASIFRATDFWSDHFMFLVLSSRFLLQLTSQSLQSSFCSFISAIFRRSFVFLFH